MRKFLPWKDNWISLRFGCVSKVVSNPLPTWSQSLFFINCFCFDCTAEEKSHLQLKQYERCVLEYIQQVWDNVPARLLLQLSFFQMYFRWQVAHDKATKFFGHMTRLANKMKDMYSEQHRLLELSVKCLFILHNQNLYFLLHYTF